mmetsp:Transcript_112447/g.223447  ORF Transcript_112447/g.223447 Transcript_112447/m.223447 type:complete len:220 (-) Transcript_112447:80-739(-)
MPGEQLRRGRAWNSSMTLHEQLVVQRRRCAASVAFAVCAVFALLPQAPQAWMPFANVRFSAMAPRATFRSLPTNHGSGELQRFQSPTWETTGAGSLATSSFDIPCWEELMEMPVSDQMFWQDVIQEQERLAAETSDNDVVGMSSSEANESGETVARRDPNMSTVQDAGTEINLPDGIRASVLVPFAGGRPIGILERVHDEVPVQQLDAASKRGSEPDRK